MGLDVIIMLRLEGKKCLGVRALSASQMAAPHLGKGGGALGGGHSKCKGPEVKPACIL